MNTVQLFDMSPQSNSEFEQIIPGFLRGSTSLSKTEDALQASWMRAAAYNLQQNSRWKS